MDKGINYAKMAMETIVVYFLFAGTVICIGGIIWGYPVVHHLHETWFEPYVVGTGLAASFLAIALGFNRYPGEDIRDLYRRRNSKLCAIIGFGLVFHQSFFIAGPDGVDLRIVAFLLLTITMIVWSQNSLQSWFGRLRETSVVWQILGL